MTPIKYVISLLLVLTGPLAYGAYDAIVGAGQTVTFRCNSASDSDCKITDGLGTSQVDKGFAYSWKAVRNKEPFEEPFEDVGSFVGDDDNSGREVEWTAPDEGIEVKVIVTADSLEDKDPDTGDSDSWTIAVVGVDLSIEGVEAVDEDDPGGFLNKDGDDREIYLSVFPSMTDGTAELAITLTSGQIEIYEDSELSTLLFSGTSDTLTWDIEDMPTTLSVVGKSVCSATGDIQLELCYKDGDDTVIAKDGVKLTVYKVDYIRLWDADKTANRTTRAVDPALRDPNVCHTFSGGFEDNARSRGPDRTETDPHNNSPGLFLGGKGSTMSTASITIECDFEPADIGKYLIWEIRDSESNVNGEDWVSGDLSGTFEISNTVSVSFSLPTTTSESVLSDHKGNDIKVRAGFDFDNDSSLSPDECFGTEFQVNIVTHAQWDEATDRINTLLLFFASLIRPYSAEFMDIFLNDNVFWKCDDDWEVFLNCYCSPYASATRWPVRPEDNRPAYWPKGNDIKMNNSLGCDQLTLVSSDIMKYIYHPGNALSFRATQDGWWNKMESLIDEMEIEQWYSDNPTENSHVFDVIDIDEEFVFNETDLHGSLKGTRLMIDLWISTDRGTTHPLITNFKTDGDIFDIYNWDAYDDVQSFTYSHPHFACGIIQACYGSSSGNDKGELFESLLQMDFDFSPSSPIVLDNDYIDDLEDEFEDWYEDTY